jgi:tetratricopeptide (TPR) repeat protein
MAKPILHGSIVDNTSPNTLRSPLMIHRKTQLVRIVVLLVIPFLFSCPLSRETEKKSYDAKTYFDMGTVQLEKGENEQAIAFFNKALEVNPKYVDAYYNRGIAYRRQGLNELAISDYTKTLELNPREARAYANRGNVYFDKGRHDDAISDYTKALEIDPKDAITYYNRSYAYYLKKDFDKSWEDVNKARALGYRIPSDFLADLQKASGRQQ